MIEKMPGSDSWHFFYYKSRKILVFYFTAPDAISGMLWSQHKAALLRQVRILELFVQMHFRKFSKNKKQMNFTKQYPKKSVF